MVGALMTVQYCRLGWPVPDVVLAGSSSPFTRKLAKHISTLFEADYLPARKVKKGSLDKNILIIDLLLDREDTLFGLKKKISPLNAKQTQLLFFTSQMSSSS